MTARVATAAAAAILALALATSAQAQDAITTGADTADEASKDGPTDRHKEMWVGADAGDNYWLVYSGTTLAPFTDIHQNGLRLRIVGGYGQYSYQIASEARATQNFDAQVNFADALIGYLWRLDPLILKLFIGGSAIDHQITPFDRNNTVTGLDWGLKGVAEFWFNIGTNGFASVDLAWSQAHNTRSARARLGYKPFPNFSAGPEFGINMDRQGDYKISEEDPNFRAEAIDYGRVGLFARYEWYGGELSGSAGLIGDFRAQRSAYGTLNWIVQF
ncbi:MAG: cellulose biosynthesis protein BcsS [Filomicrobium sp.]